MIDLFRAIHRGNQVEHVVAWKWAGVATTGITGFLSLLSGVAVVAGWIPAEIPPETIMGISSFLVSAAATVIGYTQVATTEKIGVGTKQ
jgi:hypothetical protein